MLVARQARPVAAAATSDSSPGLIAQAQRTFDASHDYVVQQVKRFGKRRGTRSSPYGWKLYLVSQTDYLRFCCSTVLEAMVCPPGARMVTGDSPEEAGPR